MHKEQETLIRGRGEKTECAPYIEEQEQCNVYIKLGLNKDLLSSLYRAYIMLVLSHSLSYLMLSTISWGWYGIMIILKIKDVKTQRS